MATRESRYSRARSDSSARTAIEDMPAMESTPRAPSRSAETGFNVMTASPDDSIVCRKRLACVRSTFLFVSGLRLVP
jgi:hypothetical protein